MLLLSLPHSGTHFLRDFIGTAPGSDGIKGTSHLREAISADGNYLYWGHFDPMEWQWIAPYTRQWRLIVPVRDPLSVAISHHVRGTKMDVSNWARATIAFDACVAHYVPLDLLKSEEEREHGLKNALRAVGIERGDSASHWRHWAHEWDDIAADGKKSHSSGDNSLKHLYRDGDFTSLFDSMPEQAADLQSHERSLRPWLERIGYRNLIWWT